MPDTALCEMPSARPIDRTDWPQCQRVVSASISDGVQVKA